MMQRLAATALLLLVLLTGCHKKYLTPGAGADLSKITTPDIHAAMAAEPAAAFPARLAVARVQGGGYRSYSTSGWGNGTLSLVTAHDVETDMDFERIARLPDVAAMASLSPLLLPGKLDSAVDLRTAAASLKADILLVYSIDTKFWIDKTSLGPLTAIGLGLLPKNKAYVTATASAAVLDTRSGFVYGVADASAREDALATSWNKQSTVEKVRLRTETKAFQGLVAEIEGLWPKIVQEHTAKRAGTHP